MPAFTRSRNLEYPRYLTYLRLCGRFLKVSEDARVESAVEVLLEALLSEQRRQTKILTRLVSFLERDLGNADWWKDEDTQS